MTKTTEELKREMYRKLENLKFIPMDCHGITKRVNFEDSLEEYLEALRQELQMWKDIADERDMRSANLRNKLQAFEFANRAAAELLSEALRESSGLRKSVGSTSGQSSGDNCSNAACACCASVLWPSAEAPKPIPMILKMEFDDRVRTLCTACNRSEDVFK